jgi:hypothetical protein
MIALETATTVPQTAALLLYLGFEPVRVGVANRPGRALWVFEGEQAQKAMLAIAPFIDKCFRERDRVLEEYRATHQEPEPSFRNGNGVRGDWSR